MLKNKFLMLNSNSKLANELGWRADENFESGIAKTIVWYLNKYGVKK